MAGGTIECAHLGNGGPAQRPLCPVRLQRLVQQTRSRTPRCGSGIRRGQRLDALASVLADEAREIVDSVPETREAIAKAKLASDMRTWLAGKWNREQYGEQKPSSVQISIGQLHIDALRQGARIVNPHQPKAVLAQPAEVIEIGDVLPNE